MVTGPTTGYLETKVDELRVDGKHVEKVERGSSFTVRIPEKIRPSDKLFKVVDNG
jgi:putative protease